MLILALDTTSEGGGAGIYRDHECLAEALHQGGANYSVTLFEAVERLMAETRVKPDEIDLYAAAKGPGSFTGIRVGLAATMGWASAYNRPAYGISTLEALVEMAQPETEQALGVLDARRGEVFIGRYRRESAQGLIPSPSGSGRPDTLHWAPEEPDRVLQASQLAQVLESLPEGGAKVTCIVRELDESVQPFQHMLPPRAAWKTVPGTLLGAIARLALRENVAPSEMPYHGLDAYYIRRPDAELGQQAGRISVQMKP